MNINTSIRAFKHSDKYLKATLKTAKVLKPVKTVAHRYGPEILTGVGITSGIGTVVLASKATLELESLVDIARANIQNAPDSKAAAKARIDGIMSIAKLYSPAATLGAVSVVSILGAHGIMRKRNVALAAAYKALDASFNEYRKRVVAELGEEKDFEFRQGMETKERTRNGEKVQVTTVDPNKHSVYARYFDELSTEWSKQPEYNLVLLRSKQNYWNDRLQIDGFVFLNDVYEDLGLERTQAGQMVGWSLKHANSDGYIDFNIYDFSSQKAREFVNGKERSILLDFNVDGVIINDI
jgi:hypothetical protein